MPRLQSVTPGNGRSNRSAADIYLKNEKGSRKDNASDTGSDG